MKPRKALIPAAGLGTRFLPATKVVPKELLPIVDRPALERIAIELALSGIEEIVLIIHPEKEIIFDHFSSGGWVEQVLAERNQSDRLQDHPELLEKVKFRKLYQMEAKGLGHAVLCGREAIENEPFLVVLPDDLVVSKVPCAAQLMAQYEKDGCSVVAVEHVARDRVSSYGIVFGSNMEGRNPFSIEGMVEKPKTEEAPSQWAIIGRYLFEPEIFNAIEETKPGKLGEIQLTDAMLKIAKEKGMTAYPFEGDRLDSGQPVGFIEANLLHAWQAPDLREKLKPILNKLLKRGE